VTARRIATKEIGLELTAILSRFFLGSEDLHYGYWPEGLEVDIRNLPQAQEEYSRLLVSTIPDGVRTILDIGCGTGALAERLLGLGFEVDCVSPGPFLTERVRARLGGRSRVHQCHYEDLDTDRRYDLALFAESFQYVNVAEALEKTLHLLADGGHMLICDVFRLPGKCPLVGGHRLARFLDDIARYPFSLVRDLDITAQTAPNIDLGSEMSRQVGYPSWRLFRRAMAGNHPLVYRILSWAFRRKIEKFERRFFSGERDGESFREFRSYRLFLYRKSGEARGAPNG